MISMLKGERNMATQDSARPPGWWELWRKNLVKVFLDLIMPTLGYYGLRYFDVPELTALTVTGLPGVAYILYRYISRRELDAIEVFLFSIVMACNAVSLIKGSPRFMLSMDGWLGVVIALAFFISMKTKLPLVYILVRALFSNTSRGARDRVEIWDQVWERKWKFRRSWRILNMYWGIVNVVNCVLRLLMAYYMPIDWVPMVGGIMTILTIFALNYGGKIHFKRQRTFEMVKNFISSEQQPVEKDKVTQVTPRRAVAIPVNPSLT
jgi:hypothetical protein